MRVHVDRDLALSLFLCLCMNDERLIYFAILGIPNGVLESFVLNALEATMQA